ncbi:MAG: Stk1 family PASTA domain-containing Ser/Thr kinase [Clostridium sp.]|nr:Stk1 family PASTA domain-containing Ser/Thr kinase [Clostridium sp.]MCM1547297.1 Stk1 family PASTA domain-containing Ser/Thr kinase [Ruminococcus sp.]
MDKNIKKRLDGRYEITELIGEGGMADVYKAVDVVDNKVVAVKILKKEFSESEEFLRRFRNESKAIAVLSHPNIVKIYDVGFSDKIQFIVMEYIDGITLKEYIENERILSWKEAVHFVTQILRALQHAHERGIVHRDIKPQNIMVFTDGTIKVMDFGIAKFAREEGRTATDQAIGTVHYISPEQARGDITDAKSDLYSVGVMLYEMLTGEKPFDGDNPVSIAVMHMQNVAELPRRVNPDIPSPLEEIIVHAMEKNPSDRYQTAVDMLRDIDRFKADPDAEFGYLANHAVSDMNTRYFSAVNNDYMDDIDVPEYTNGNDDVYNDNDIYEDTYDEDYSDLDDEEYEGEKKKSLFVPVLSAVTVVVIMVAVFFIATLIKNVFTGESGGTSEFAMPNLVGMDYNQAVEAYPKLDIQVDSTEWSDLEKDKIFYQSVAEGDGVKKGEIIKVKVSLGAKTVKVPNVINYHFKTAEEALRAEGLEVEFKYQENKDVDEEIVFQTEPSALEEVAPGTTILVYVSKGKDVEEIVMDDFVGKHIDDAKIQCGIWGISVKIVKKNSSKEAGTILEQSIEEGEKVPTDSTITFTVSTGKEPEGTVDMTFIFPEDSTGRFTIGAYQNNVMIYESFTLSADYSKENLISVTGKGTDVEITMVLTNLANNMTAAVGTYIMNFEDGTFETIEEDVDIAFATVNGLYQEPTDPPYVPEPEPDPDPEPVYNDDSSDDESSSEENGESE